MTDEQPPTFNELLRANLQARPNPTRELEERLAAAQSDDTDTTEEDE